MEGPRRILFVTDDPGLPAQIREALADMTGVWEAGFAASGAEAMAAFARIPYQVVVSDLPVADLRGEDFLRKIMVHHPGAARFVLSGSADETSGWWPLPLPPPWFSSASKLASSSQW